MNTTCPNEKVPLTQRFSLMLDVWTFWLVLLGFVLLYIPSCLDLVRKVWITDEQGHGPVILWVSLLWLLFSQLQVLATLELAPAYGLCGALLLAGLASYVLGRKALWVIWFPLSFLVFMMPFLEPLAAEVTDPLRSAVSVVAADWLYYLGYLVSRAVVMLNVGSYQLLVADACAGLDSMFTFEALGLLYLDIMNYTSPAHNIALGILVLPIAFVVNVTWVMILVLVTYHFTDAAEQGFVHSFAGILLFIVGLVLVLLRDYFLGKFFIDKPGVLKKGDAA